MKGIKTDGGTPPTLYYPANAEEAYEADNSTVKALIPTSSEGDDGEEPAGAFALSLPDTDVSVKAGETSKIEATSTLPEGAALVWTSSDDTVATVSSDGTVTGVKAGTATITASITLNGVTLVSASRQVTVSASSSGSYYPSVPTVQKPTIEADANATVTLDSTGTTATITVADGYELADVTVNGVSKGAVTTLTGLKTGDKVVVTTRKADSAGDDAALIEAVKKTRLVARSMYATAPSGKKSIKVYWFNKDGSELDFDGYEVYRSLKKNSGYGKTPIFKTTKERYFNTAIKKGTKYYYKVRGYKVINGEKVYTEYSLKAWRTAK